MKTWKKMLAILLSVVFIAACPVSAGAETAGSTLPFPDVSPSNWFYGSVAYAYENGLINGYGDGTFKPNTETTRGMVVAILYNLEGAPEMEGMDFPDVPNGKWYEKPIKWASAVGIVAGYGDGHFKPDAPITREQMAVIMRNYASYKGYDVSGSIDFSNYPDSDTVSAYASESMSWAIAAGIITGVGGTHLKPKSSATRAQVAAIFMRFCQKFNNTGEEFYTVIFDGNAENANNIPEPQTVRAGECVEEPEDPSLDGYSFIGWSNDADGANEFDFSTVILDDITLYAQWRLASDNLNDDFIDIGDIENLSSEGVIEVIYGEEGEVRVIDGRFTNKKVDSSETAADVLNSASSLFGDDFCANASEISVQTISTGNGEESFYRYSPIVNGVPVMGSQIIISTDDSDYVSGLFSSYVKAIYYVNTDASISASEAENIVIEELLQRSDVSNFLNIVSNDSTNNNAVSEDVIEANNEKADSFSENAVGSNSEESKLNSDEDIETNSVEANSELGVPDEAIIGAEISMNEIVNGFKESLSLNSNLLIYTVDENEPPLLVYSVDVMCNLTYENEDSGNNVDLVLDLTYYIYANEEMTGNVYVITDNTEGATDVLLTAPDLRGNTRIFHGVEENNEYQLKDTTRNLETYKTTSSGILWWKSYNLPGEIASSFTFFFSERINKTAVSAHANMAEVYDYYKSVLGRKSFDGLGAKIIVSYDYGNNYKNAYWSSQLQQMVFGSSGNYAAALDVAGHEFTHAVINYVVGDGINSTLTYRGESGALNESYADILGSLIEGKSDNGMWLIGEDSDGAIRSMEKPSSYDQPEHYDQRYTGTLDNAGVHINSGIFNYAAQKMMTDNRTESISKETWAKVFYISLYRLTTTATFLEARGAVVASAKRLGFNQGQQQAIKDAFDSVGICEPDAIRIVLTWGASPSDLDSHLVGPLSDGSGRFHVYYSYPEVYQAETNNYVADLDYDDTSSYGPEVTTIHLLTPGEYYFYVHDYSNGDSPSSTEMATSGAEVKVYRGSSNRAINTFRINPDSIGTIWNVFKLTIKTDNSIDIEEINTYGSSSTYG